MNINHEHWWREIDNKTSNWSKPAVIENAFDSSFFHEDDVRIILRNLSNVDRNSVKIRAYLNKGLRADKEIEIIKNPPKYDQSIYDWCLDIFGSNTKFGIVLSSCHMYSNRIACNIANYYRKDRDDRPSFNGEIETYLFIGNYGYTPFGIHHDTIRSKDGGEDVPYITHFHIGPGSKIMHVWDNETYFQLNNNSYDSSFAPETMLDHSITTKIIKQSVYCLPPNNFHIGYSGEFSIGLASSFKRMSRVSVYNATIKEMGGLIEPLVNGTLDAKESSNVDIINIYTKSKEMLDCRISSNAFLSHKLLYTNDKLNEVSAGSIVHHVKPFSIKYFTYDKKGYLFFRGNKLILRSIPAIDEMCYFICNNHAFKVNELIELLPKVDRQLIFKVIDLLQKSFSIKIKINTRNNL